MTSDTDCAGLTAFDRLGISRDTQLQDSPDYLEAFPIIFHHFKSSETTLEANNAAAKHSNQYANRLCILRKIQRNLIDLLIPFHPH